MRAQYDSFLNSKLKVMGFEVRDYYLVFILWTMFSYLKMDELLKLILLASITVTYLYFKMKLNPGAILFLIKKKKFTYITIGEK